MRNPWDGEIVAKTISVVGIDLDGTLLELSDQFIAQYLLKVDQWVASRLRMEPVLAKAIWETTVWACSLDHGPTLLEDAFFERLCSLIKISREDIKEVFQMFYQEVFPELQRLSHPIVGAMGFLTQIQALGLKVVLLTSPVFPRIAIDERLRWAGIEGFPFDWISSLEVVHAAKPHPAYYLGAAKTLDIAPSNWLMVGNDLEQDIRPARVSGMHTWWVSDGRFDYAVPDEDVLKGPLHDVIPYLKAHLSLAIE